MPKVDSLIARAVCGACLFAAAMYGQVVYDVTPAEPISIPFVIDSNSATFWRNGELKVYSSAGTPMLNTLDGKFRHLGSEPVTVDRTDHFPMWIESVWEASDGVLYGWYHYERMGACPNSNLNIPEIGGLVSYDGGRTFRDLGIVLNSGELVNCSAKNGYFAGGYGDFSVIVDRRNEYLYFLFGAYGGDVSGQGVAIARMLVGNAANPTGAVWKYYQGAWSEPGLGGRVTPIFPATVSWVDANTDSFWGPSVHWNTYLERYVVLLNRSCCAPEWPQEGVYLTTNSDLENPAGWTTPQKILGGGDWYPWVMGAGEGESSSKAGQRVRLFVRQNSEWEIVFRRESDTPPPPASAPQPPTESTSAAPAETAPPLSPEPVPPPPDEAKPPDPGESQGSQGTL